jgi:hypothetical protein
MLFWLLAVERLDVRSNWMFGKLLICFYTRAGLVFSLLEFILLIVFFDKL